MLEAIFSLIGVLIGSGLIVVYSYWRDRREREEKYRLMLYEKRLEAHQGAFYHVQQLLEQFGSEGYPNEKELASIYREAKSFYDSNRLYLHEQSRDEMFDGLNKTRIYLEEPDADYIKVAFEKLWRTRQAIEAGIGMKHIEEPKKEQPENKS